MRTSVIGTEDPVAGRNEGLLPSLQRVDPSSPEGGRNFRNFSLPRDGELKITAGNGKSDR